MRKRDKWRLLENEVIFRQINEDVDGFLRDIGMGRQDSAPFYCECSNMDCHMRIELSPAAYERIHKNPRQFIAIDGHEVPKIERVVKRHRTYNVIEKLENDMPSADQAEYRLKEL
jgi:hypothetical protein